jgi:hypothetical protein
VLTLEALDQIADARGLARGFDIGERVATVVDQPAQLPRPGAGRGCAPVGELADGVAPLAPALGRVIQDEGPGPRGSDPAAEAGHAGIVSDPVALRRRREPLDDGVGEMHSLVSDKCPSQ